MNPHFNMRVGANAVIVRDGKVLLVEFDDENGLHYNFPGGGIREEEAIEEGLRREVREETCAEVTVGPLLTVMEYLPARELNRYGTLRKLTLFFLCKLLQDSEAQMPSTPDPNQTGVRWVPLDEIPAMPLLPTSLAHELPTLLKKPISFNRFWTRMT